MTSSIFTFWFLSGVITYNLTARKLGYSMKSLKGEGESFLRYSLRVSTGPFAYFLYKRRLQKEGGRWEIGEIERYKALRKDYIEGKQTTASLIAIEFCEDKINRLESKIK